MSYALYAVIAKFPKHTAIPVGRIMEVRWKDAGALVPGHIQFVVAGEPERSEKEASLDPNAVEFYKEHQDAFRL